jgi:Tfp pilus assembly protein PilN
MTSFDYLHSPRPELVDRVLDLRIPPRLHGPLFMLFGSLIFVAAAWCIEAHRLNNAVQTNAAYQSRYDRGHRALQGLHLYADRIRSLVALDELVRAINASGENDAECLVEAANAVPAQAWLSGISRDETGLTLDGTARDLTVVAAMIRDLSRARDLRDPVLVRADREPGNARHAYVRFSVHLRRAPQ